VTRSHLVGPVGPFRAPDTIAPVTSESPVVVDVMLKPEILDPAGQAVLGAAARLVPGVRGIRIGKHIELTLDGPVTDEDLAKLHDLAGSLLSNPVIEDYTLRVPE